MPVVDQEHEVPGVVLDMNPYGMLVRLLEPFEKGEDVIVQLMRDEDYTETFSRPLTCRIVRHAGKQGALTDVGLKIIQEPVRRSESRPPAVSQPRPRLQSARTRMHTIDLTVNERLRRRGR